MTHSRQLLLDLPVRTAMGREDFFVTDANRAAVALVDQWPNWPSYGAVISGSRGSGKTHLAEVFRAKSNASTFSSGSIEIELVEKMLELSAIVIEDFVPGQHDERAIFHLLNLTRQTKKSLLITGSSEFSTSTFKIPDLASRIKALPQIAIMPPDDTLLRAVLVKKFSDHQLSTDERIITFLLQRMPRSMEAVRQVVGEIDRRALAEKSELTRPFVARILTDMVNLGLIS